MADKMTFYDRLNSLYEFLQYNYLSANAQTLYFNILLEFNCRYHWKADVIYAKNSLWVERCGMGESAFRTARNELKQKGLIDFKADNRRGHSTEYKLCPSICPSEIKGQTAGQLKGQTAGQLKGQTAGQTDIYNYNNIYNKELENRIEKENTSKPPKYKAEIEEIVAYLNEKAGTHYRATSADTQKHIKSRLGEGFTVEDFKKAIDNKTAEWLGTEMQGYLRPQTLFGTKFEGYVNAAAVPRKADERGFDIYNDVFDHSELEEMTRK